MVIVLQEAVRYTEMMRASKMAQDAKKTGKKGANNGGIWDLLVLILYIFFLYIFVFLFSAGFGCHVSNH